MIPSDYAELVRRLAKSTEEDTVIWRPTSDEGEFIVYFTKFSVSVRAGWDAQDDEPLVAFIIRDTDGTKVDTFYVNQSEKQFPFADGLFNAARRKALRIDEAIQSILDELRNEPSSEPNDPETNDPDIPF